MTDPRENLQIEILIIVSQYLNGPSALLGHEELICVRSGNI
jgi:hypothetical protein